jgi:hypothetical protein
MEMKLRHALPQMNMLSAPETNCVTSADASSYSRNIIRGISMKPICYSVLALFATATTASAITVKAPANGAQVTSPFSLVATTASCGFETALSIGYSLDNGATIMVPTSFKASLPTRDGPHIFHLHGGLATIVPDSVSALVVAGDGPHTLHVTCWGPLSVTKSIVENITVIPADTPPPSNVTVVSNIQSLTGWKWDHDPGTPGSAEGSSDIVASPSLNGNSREYSLSFTDSGGEIFHVSFGHDPAATHFTYSTDIWLADPSGIANIEMDMNQVIANGDTVIYGFQCDGYSGTWDYTKNLGTPANPEGHWEHSNVPCPDPKTWTPNTWHNVQVAYHRDDAGNVTYDSVVLDGQQSDFVGATGNSAFSLGWGPTLLTNFQIDGHGANGSVTAYVDNLTVSRW